MFRKAIVIGCPGAGKSTFARKLRDATGLPLHYLDMLWHKPDRTTVSRDAFDAALAEILKTDAWIIDGNYQRTLERRLEACDAVFFLDYPVEVCLAGAAARVGQKREEMPWVEETFDEEFRKFILDFHRSTRPVICRLLDTLGKDRNVVVFRSREEAERYFANAYAKKEGEP